MTRIRIELNRNWRDTWALTLSTEWKWYPSKNRYEFDHSWYEERRLGFLTIDWSVE